MVTVVEARAVLLGAGEVRLTIYRFFNSTTQQMDGIPIATVLVKSSNIRCEQAVA